MTIVLTGGTGFLGRAIKNEFKDTVLTTVGRNSCDINVDLRFNIPVIPKADIVIHAAGKAHMVPKTISEINDFYNTNIQGTYNLLKGLNVSLPKSLIFISSVAVYGKDKGILITEDQPLIATDPYGHSKIEAELLVKKWCTDNNVICTILRLPLLVGENPPGNLGSMIGAIKKGYYFNIDGGKARKSMVLVEDVAKIIPIVAQLGGIYNLTDGYHPSFAELASSIANQLGKKKILNLPFWTANLLALIGDMLGNRAPINSKKMAKIISDLTFDDSKAKKELNWKPNPVLSGFNIK